MSRCKLFVWWLLSMIAGIWELRYTGIQTTRHSVLSTRPGTKVLGQIPRYSVGANCLLGGFWAPAGVHDRIPSDSCKSRFNITALKRPTTVQQCPMILQKTFHRLACLLALLHIRPTNSFGAQVLNYPGT